MSPEDFPGSSSVAGDQGEDAVDWGKLRHYLHAPLRRPWAVVLPWVAIVVVSVAAFLLLPKRYKSSTLILIESEKVPDSFVARVATEDRGQRLQTMRPEILSRTRLETVLEETNPYPAISSRTAAVERLRRSISINVSGNDGFTIEFVHTDPEKAQEVTNRIATLFIEETIKSREEQVEGAVDFLSTQVADARKQLETKEEALRRYKEQRLGRLPEQLQTNLATMQMLQQELRTIEESLIFAREKRDALARGARSTAGGSPTAAPTGTDELAELRRQLAELRGRYTDEHPDVQSLRARIARLDARLSAMSAAGGAASDDDPSLGIARQQLEQAQREVKRLEDKRTDLESRLSAIRVRVEDTPRTEQELANLKRDYDQLNENYVTLVGKQLEAQMAGRLERRWKGDRFRMLDPANLPEKPYFPKATLIIGLGVMMGLFVGLGAALVMEYLDPSVKDAQELQTMLPLPVLARIPHLPRLSGQSTR